MISKTYIKTQSLFRLLSLSLIILSLSISSAFAQRIGIVYSESSANRFHNKFIYSQLFMAMQNQARMAGIPYDLLSENDLTDAAKLTGYNALLIPGMQYVSASKLTAIENALNEAVFNHQVGLIVSGDLMTHNESGGQLSNPYARMQQWLGITYAASANGVAMEIRAQDVGHPAMVDYAAGELIQVYDQIWFDSYAPIGGQSADVLAKLKVGGQSHNGVLATHTGGRNVHFANDQVIGDTNLVWAALQWVIHGDQVSAGLKLGRQDNIFIARNDMDQSMFIDELHLTEIPLYDLLVEWKANYNFIGSYYLNIGNNIAQGEYTDWSISAPLYQNYISLGSEIGTHSWTHQDHTALLSSAELEYEFNQSKIELENQLNINVLGAAIPGNPESLEVDQQIENYFSYVSGRGGIVGYGYPGAIGRLWPNADMIYFSLNLSPDFTLVEWLGHSAIESEQIWAEEYSALRKHASQPIIHWLWHDYGPTISASGNDGGSGDYTVALYTNTIAMAHANDSEFVTLADLQTRIRSYEAASLAVTGSNPITANINAQGVGQFSLQLQPGEIINKVNNWYAYDEDQVFLPDNGGQFIIHLGDSQADVTHINDLPMRARLLTLSGDGDNLAFSFEGEGSVRVSMSSALAADLSVEGGSNYTRNGNQVVINFNSFGVHTAALSTGVDPVNLPPVAYGQPVNTQQDIPVDITLNASDANGDALTYQVVTAPAHGQLNGSAPNLIYNPAAGYTGSDSFTFIADDGLETSNMATISITINPNVGNISNPVTGITLDGSLNDWNGLTSFGPDPNDISGSSNLLDWLEGWIAHDESNFYLAYRNDGPITLSWAYNLYLDTDSNSATGFVSDAAYPIGAEYLIQASFLYKYTGNGSSWSWSYVGELTAAVSGNQAEFSLPRNWLGNPPELQLFFLGENVAYSGGSTIDYYPDGAADPTATSRFFTYSTEQTTTNLPPVASDQAITTNQDSPIAITLIASDPEQASLSYTINTGPTHGQLSGTAPNLTYNPDAGYSGSDSITFTANDGALDSNAATLTLTIKPSSTNQPPQANDQAIVTDEDTPVDITLSAIDPEGDALTYTVVSGPNKGQLSQAAPGLVYTPDANFSGVDSFNYQASDGQANGNIATVSITVHQVNDVPLFAAEPILLPNATAGQVYSGTIAGTVTDVDGDTLIFGPVSGPAWLTINANGTLSGSPQSTDLGLNSWSIQASDGHGGTAQSSLQINVVEQQSTKITFTSIAAEDGWVRESTKKNNVGGKRNISGAGSRAIRMGDNKADKQYKSILSFDTASIPEGATILSATLQITRGGDTGTNPFTTHGTCLVDMIKGSFGGNPALQNSDFQAQADSVASITNQGGNGATYRVNLDSAIDYVNNAGRTQLRLYFSNDDNGDGGNDFAGYYSANSSNPAHHPKLIVTYQE